MAFPDDIGVKLVCPKCRADVVRHGESFVCTAPECRLQYPIIDDIPKFIIEDAVPLDADAWQSIIYRAQNGDGRATRAPEQERA